VGRYGHGRQRGRRPYPDGAAVRPVTAKRNGME
jgi:hypothetical protein